MEKKEEKEYTKIKICRLKDKETRGTYEMATDNTRKKWKIYEDKIV